MRVAARPASNPTAAAVPVSPIQPKAPPVSPAAHNMHVFVSKRVLRICWLLIMALHCGLALYPAAIGMLYRYLLTTAFKDSIMSYSLAVDYVYFESIARGYFFISAVHTTMVVLYIVRSIQYMELTFRPPIVGSGTLSMAATAPACGSDDGQGGMMARVVIVFKVAVARALIQSVKAVCRALLQAAVCCIPRAGLRCLIVVFDAGKAVFMAMDIQSENYEVFFVVREIMQTFLQTYQAYRMSTFVPRLWMNNISVGFIVLNCWSTPLIQFCGSRSASAAATRLSCALASVVMDMILYAVIPLVLFYPYYQQFDRGIRTYDRRYGYMDIWLIRMINELQVLFVVSLYDAFSRCMIAISIPRWLHAITKILRPYETPKGSVSIAPHVQQPARVSLVRLRSNLHQAGSTRKQQFVMLGNRFLALWGLFVLVVHIHAASHSFHPQCRLRTWSWFTSKPGCSLLEINCVEENVNGAESDITQIIDRVEASQIEHMVFRHCSRLEVPVRMTTLSHLMGFKVHNSSLAAWEDEAAITTTHHPRMRFVFLLDVNMTAFPPGLLSPDFPPKLSQVVISRSNLTAIPEHLDTIWPKRLVLILEELQLSSFPAVVPRLAPLYLSLALNNLTDIPASSLNNAIIPLLILSGNPFRLLPSKLPGPRPPAVAWLSMVSTGIEDLPDWIKVQGEYENYPYVTAAHTPLCDRMIASGEAAKSIVSTAVGRRGVDCFTELSPGRGNWYPLVMENEWNPSYKLGEY